jgi:hypothetical protein
MSLKLPQKSLGRAHHFLLALLQQVQVEADVGLFKVLRELFGVLLASLGKNT